jgi:hypothetical protein
LWPWFVGGGDEEMRFMARGGGRWRSRSSSRSGPYLVATIPLFLFHLQINFPPPLKHKVPLLIVEDLAIQGSCDGSTLKGLFTKKNGALSNTPKKRHSTTTPTYIVF